MNESPLVDSGFVVHVFSPRDDPIACLNKAMAFLTVVASLRGDKGKVIQVLVIRVMLLVMRETMQVDSQGLSKTTTVKVKDIWLGNTLSLSDQVMQHDPGVLDGQVVQTIIPNNAAFQTKDFNTYDSNCDDILNAKLVLMANISNYGFDVISEVPHSETYLNEMENQAQRIKPTLYDGIVISAKHVAMPVIDDEETLILEEESRSKMSEKEKDPEAIKQIFYHKPIDYEKLNRVSDDFGKCLTPQQELSAEQAFWLRMSNPTSKPYDASPVKIEAPKVSLVNESLKKLKFHLARFDNVVKIRTTPDARIEGE
ncbi:hypothetical protein Tco_0736417 [Tanacetum coccineum]